MSMRKKTLVLTFLAVLAPMSLAPGLALAQQKTLNSAKARPAPEPVPITSTIRVCNRSAHPALVAVAFIPIGESEFSTEGWYRVGPGDCQNLAETRNRHFYAYADMDEQDRHWGGGHDLCVEYPGPFSIRQSATGMCRDDEELRGFMAMDTGEVATYTWNLDP